MSTPSTQTAATESPSIPAQTRIGHVHLRVAEIDRAIWFYRDVLGFDLLVNMGTAAFLSAGGYHHHIAVNTWGSKDGAPPPPGTTGLFHFAINYPTRRDLAAALKRLLDHGWGIDGASDHSTHEAIYLHDPDQNGLELAWDRDPSYWSLMRDPEKVGSLRSSLDFEGLLAELGDPDTAAYLPGLRAYT